MYADLDLLLQILQRIDKGLEEAHSLSTLVAIAVYKVERLFRCNQFGKWEIIKRGKI